MDTLNHITKKFKSDSSYTEDLIDNSDDEDNYLKNASSNRKHTDVPFLILHGILLLVLFCLLGYCISNGKIERLTKGYDNCGNICGEKNSFSIVSQSACSAEDMTDKPYLKVDGYQRVCVAHCNRGSVLLGHHCLPEPENDEVVSAYQFQSFMKGFFKDMYICSYEILSLLGIALVFALIIILVLRHMIAVFIWSVLIGTILAFAGFSAYCGYIASQLPSGFEYRDEVDSTVRCSITFGVAAFVIAIITLVIRKRIPFVTQLFREAGKSIIAIPLLLFEPLVTIITLIIVWISWFYFALWIESSGTPTESGYGKVTFEQNDVIYFTYWYSVFMTVWMIQFVCGCQDMLISGAISAWYFASNKNKLGKPILRSTYNMLKYHLGTISVSSLIIAILQFIRLVIALLRRPLRALTCLQYYLNYLERWIRYFTKNACIITSIHGYDFRQAGARAFNLIINSITKVLAISTVGDYVLALAKLLVAAGATSLGYLMIRNKPELEYMWTIIILMGVMAYIVAHCFFSVYAIAIDTIFICFCEDCEVNDGISRPYYMSRELMEFIQRSKMFLDPKGQQGNTTNGVVILV
ncbi:hypothetical protein ILUMI_20635 [Ignelater luminosus]|uniref:Choline transporter-like protein n=1 Tax=Ignelater luminosus TaxID=2038154 RepID=A0A8K0G257_IGNLU|nr:hypothetical protein ILUMI_20635 [Ignelater luminosus]